MEQEQHKKVIFNRADVEETKRIHCDKCFEHVVFLMRDKEHEFSLGLTTALECIEFAIKNGDLPKLPRSWCADVESTYYITFDEDISYYDYDTF